MTHNKMQRILRVWLAHRPIKQPSMSITMEKISDYDLEVNPHLYDPLPPMPPPPTRQWRRPPTFPKPELPLPPGAKRERWLKVIFPE
jgi:hypothetical protein